MVNKTHKGYYVTMDRFWKEYGLYKLFGFVNKEKARFRTSSRLRDSLEARQEELKKQRRKAWLEEERIRKSRERAFENMSYDELNYLEGCCLGDSYL